MEVIVHLPMLEVDGRSGDGGGEVYSLLHAHTDTTILVQTVEQVSLLTRHDLMERGGVSLGVNHTDCLFHLGVNDHNLSRVHQEQLVMTSRREGHLETVVEWQCLLTSVTTGEGKTP